MMLTVAAVALLPLVSAYSQTFVVPHVDGQDDSPTVMAALAKYNSDSLILFKKGVTYNLWTVSDNQLFPTIVRQIPSSPLTLAR
jgi:hypothetical protein